MLKPRSVDVVVDHISNPAGFDPILLTSIYPLSLSSILTKGNVCNVSEYKISGQALVNLLMTSFDTIERAGTTLLLLNQVNSSGKSNLHLSHESLGIQVHHSKATTLGQQWKSKKAECKM